MNRYAVSVVGRDRPGIAAAVAEALYAAKANIEDSRMSILGGHFAMMLVVSLEDAEAEGLAAGLESVRASMDLAHATAQPIEDASGDPRPISTHVLTVYGADHPGIVAAVCHALAAREVNIDDLATRVVGAESDPVYTLICEVTLPAELDPDLLEEDLLRVSTEQGVDVSLREQSQDIL